jgi:hypothetical protein
VEVVVVLALGVLAFALIGFVATVRWVVRSARAPDLPAPAPEPYLGRAERLEIVRQVLGPRMPEELAAELARLRAPAVPTAPPPSAAPASAPAPFAVAVADELAVAPEVAVAMASAPSLSPVPAWVRSFLSFENTIFLLAACLVLGGTLYVVATTWGRVPGRWQHLFLEGVILFYGAALMGAARFLQHRLHLTSAARFLGATCGITMIAGALVAGAAFDQYRPAGLIGAALVVAVGTGVAGALVRMTGGRAASAVVFGGGLLLLSAAGGFNAADRPVLAAILLIASVAVGGPLWLGTAGAPTIPTLAVAAALPAATLLFPIAGWLPAAFAAPALAAGGSLVAAAGGLLGGLTLALVLVVLQAIAAGMAGASVGALTAVAALGIPASVVLLLRAPPGAGEPAPEAARPARQLGGLLLAVQWIAVAFLWARACGLLDDLGAPRAWPWNAASAWPFALAPLWLALPASGGRRRALPGAEAFAWLIVAAALAMALAPFPALGLTSAAVGVASSVLAHAWARRVGAPARWITAHASALLAIWMVARALWPAGALALAATGAIVVLLVPGAPAWIVGTLAAPACVLAAAVGGAPPFWLAALLAVYGAAHLFRPGPPAAEPALWDSRPLGPPALLAALGVALFYTGSSAPPLLAIGHWPRVLAGALVPMAAFVAWRGGPRFLVVETMVGVGAAALGGAPLPALALACGLLLGRPPGAVAAAAVALGPLLSLAIAAGAGPIPCAALTALAGAILARRTLPAPSALERIRWLAAPALAAAPLVLLLAPGPAGASFVAPALWPVVAAAVLIPFAAALAWRGAPDYLRIEVLVGAAGLAAAAFVEAATHWAASPEGIRAGASALVALGCGLTAAHRTGGRVSRAGWVIALLLAPVAVVAMTELTLRWPAAVVGAGAVLTLAAVSRRQRAPDVGAWALSAGLVVVWWGLAALAKHFSTGAPPVHVIPVLATGTALYGMAIALDGPRLAAASPRFLRGFALTLLALAGLAIVTTTVAIGAPRDLDATLALTAFATVVAQALVVAFVHRIGWPFYLAETALGAGYAYLRVRTTWLDALAGWDGLLACVGGVACAAASRWLRGVRAQLGVAESQLMATLFPLLASVMLRPHEPRTAAGAALAAVLFVAAARANARPLYGWLAALMANLSLVPLWISADVSSPVAYALPAGVSLMIICRVYADDLRGHAPALRTVASLLIFGSTSFEMFQFDAVWPAALQGATAVLVVLLGIRSRVRGYVYLGFTALLLDIVANLTRWGLQDRLVGGVLSVLGGILLFALGALVAHHKALALARYRRLQAWPW